MLKPEGRRPRRRARHDESLRRNQAPLARRRHRDHRQIPEKLLRASRPHIRHELPQQFVAPVTVAPGGLLDPGPHLRAHRRMNRQGPRHGRRRDPARLRHNGSGRLGRHPDNACRPAGLTEPKLLPPPPPFRATPLPSPSLPSCKPASPPRRCCAAASRPPPCCSSPDPSSPRPPPPKTGRRSRRRRSVRRSRRTLALPCRFR